MSGEKDFLDDFVEDDAAAIIEHAPAEVEPVSSGRQRGPDGKFVKAEAEAKAQEVEKGAKQAADDAALTEPPSDEDESQTVPLSALKALRRELQELKRSQGLSGQTQRPQAPELPKPSVEFERDPRTYIEQSLLSQKTHMSMHIAGQQYGEDVAQEAWTAFVQSPDPMVIQYSYQLLEHPHPVGEMVKWYREQQDLRALRDAGGIEALIQQRLAAMGGQPAAQGQGRNIPPSLAGTGKVRSSDPTGEITDGFDALFKR